MPVELIRFLATTFGVAFTSSARPAMTFFAVQCFAAGLVRFELASLPNGFEWLVALPTLGVGLVLTIVEWMAAHDPDVGESLRMIHLDKAVGALGAFASALFFVSIGLPEIEADGLIAAGGGVSDVIVAAHSTQESAVSTPVQFGVIGAAVAINLGLTWLRGHVLEALAAVDLEAIWQRIETGGIIGLLMLLLLMPFLALGLVVALTLALVVVGLMFKGVDFIIDKQSRTPCSSCGYSVRVEASRCPSCHSALTPQRSSSERLSLRERVSALFAMAKARTAKQ